MYYQELIKEKDKEIDLLKSELVSLKNIYASHTIDNEGVNGNMKVSYDKNKSNGSDNDSLNAVKRNHHNVSSNSFVNANEQRCNKTIQINIRTHSFRKNNRSVSKHKVNNNDVDCVSCSEQQQMFKCLNKKFASLKNRYKSVIEKYRNGFGTASQNKSKK